MSKRSSRRYNSRKEQSERDKMNSFCNRSYYGSMAAFQHLLDVAKKQGMCGELMMIPLEIIDFAAVFITSLVNGHDFLLPSFYSSSPNPPDVNFISRTLARAQVSCSSLLLSLWYIDQYFQPGRRRCCKSRSSSRRQKAYFDECHNSDDNIHSSWHPRDLFIASIVVADKYLADITWTNADWAEWTNYAYSCEEITRLERRFLQDLHYRLFIDEREYIHFCSFLEFRLHSRRISDALSYRDIHVLSQSLLPTYVERLHLSLRPYEAMLLLAKTVTSICIVYATTVMAGYILYQYAAWIQSQLLQAIRLVLLQRQVQEHMIVMTANLARKSLASFGFAKIPIIPHAS